MANLDNNLVVTALDLEKKRIQDHMGSAIRDLRNHIDRLATDPGTHEARQIAILGVEMVALVERLTPRNTGGAVFADSFGPTSD